MKIKLLAIALIVVAAGLGACKKKKQSSEKEITSVKVNGITYDATADGFYHLYGKVSEGVWDEGTPTGPVAPEIVFKGVKIEPLPSVQQNFIDNTVTYTVTAEDGSTKQYKVSAGKTMTL